MLAKADSMARRFLQLRIMVALARAEMSLSQGRTARALDFARSGLSAGGVSPGLEISLRETLGLAAVRMGNKRAGLEDCEKAREAAASSSDPADSLLAAAALMEALLENRDGNAALQVFREIQPRLDGFPELQWRVLALASRADGMYAKPARESLEKLQRQWGEAVYNTYLARPDIAKLSRPLFRPVPASR